jgi:hypothetical protein
MRYILLLSLFLISPLWAADYYCDLTESDNGAGTTGDPWQWSQAQNDASTDPGDTVYFRGAGTTISLDQGNVKGSGAGYVKFHAWSGQTAPSVTNATFLGSNAEVAIVASTDTWTAGSGDTIGFDANDGMFFRSDSSLRIILTGARSDGDLLAYSANVQDTPKDVSSYGSSGSIHFFIRSDTTLSAGDIEIVFAEDANGAKTNDYVEAVTESASVVDRWSYQEIPTNLSSMNAIISVGVYANANIVEGTEIWLDFMCAEQTYDAYLEFDGWTFAQSASNTAAQAISLTNVNHLKFIDCTVSGRARSDPADGDFHPYHDVSSKCINDSQKYVPCQYITIDTCTISGAGRGIQCQSPNWTIQDCTMTDFGEDGINCVGIADGLTIQRNTIYDLQPNKTGWKWPGTATGTLNEGDEVFQDRNADSSFDSGEPNASWWRAAGGYGFLFITDDVDNVLQADTYVWRTHGDPGNNYFTPSGGGDVEHSDGVSIEAFDGPITIKRNKIYRTEAQAGEAVGFQQLKISNEVNDVNVINNLIYVPYAGSYMFLIGGCGDMRVINNVIVCTDDNGAFRINYGAVTPDDLRLVWYNNICSGGVHDSGEGTISSQGHNIWSDAEGDLPSGMQSDSDSFYNQNFSSGMFTDYANQDFTIVAGSPAINAGDSTYTPSDDYAGTARVGDDIGAYEYAATTSTTDYGTTKTEKTIRTGHDF